MKKNISLILVGILIILSGCGVTVTKVESTTELTTEVTDFTGQSEATVSAMETTATNTASDTTTTAKNTSSTTKKITSKTASQKTTSQNKTVTCTIEINCQTILDNIDKLRPEKKAFLPQNGIILSETTVTVVEGSTVFDVIKIICSKNTCTDKCTYCKKTGIQLDYLYNKDLDSQYIRGIHQIYEKDCGTGSGWEYSVNGIFPNFGVNKYTVKDNDIIKILYTCDRGEDIGNNYIS